jgi:RNA polymerase sigma factor (sigma-70 family)
MAKEYFVVIDGENVPVSEEVYRAFKRPLWAERKRRQVRAEWELSLDALMGEGLEFQSDDKLVDEIVEDKLLLDMLMAALAELTDNERGLIDALFFDEKSERELSKETGVPQKTINNRKQAILKKLKKFF